MWSSAIRYIVVLTLSLSAMPLAAEGPPADTLPRIGFLGNSTAAGPKASMSASQS
jgi:hypothetical protein